MYYDEVRNGTLRLTTLVLYLFSTCYCWNVTKCTCCAKFPSPTATPAEPHVCDSVAALPLTMTPDSKGRTQPVIPATSQPPTTLELNIGYD